MSAVRRPQLDWTALDVTGEWIASHQRPDGAIPSFRGRRMDPWDHVQSAMALVVTGRYEAARAAFRFLAKTQGADGAWPASSNGHGVIDATRESNHAAYVATGLWHYHRATDDTAFLEEMWPTLERAMAFVLALQDDNGVVFWARDADGVAWPAPLLAGCSSIYGSLGCAIRIATRLGRGFDRWVDPRRRLGAVVRGRGDLFAAAPVPDPPGRYAMDWYYPVLGGVLRGDAGRKRLVDGHAEFIDEGSGCRCVRDRAWFTAAETCELVIALELCNLHDHAISLFEWVQSLRCEDGGYWMGVTIENGLRWPPERPSWTAATVILAADALSANSATSDFFRTLSDVPEPHAVETAPSIKIKGPTL